MRHAPFQGMIASHFAFVQALAATAAHRPTEYELRKCHRVRLMFKSPIGGQDPDVPEATFKNAQRIARRFDEKRRTRIRRRWFLPQLFCAMLLGTCWPTLRREIAVPGPSASRELEAWRGVALSRKDARLKAKQLHRKSRVTQNRTDKLDIASAQTHQRYVHIFRSRREAQIQQRLLGIDAECMRC